MTNMQDKSDIASFCFECGEELAHPSSECPRCPSDSLIRSDPNLTGREAYEASLRVKPTYHTGKPRKTWDELGYAERLSWERPPRGYL